MTNLKLPEDFETYPEARKNAFLKMKELKESGRRIVGVFCTYTPWELIEAADAAAIPFRRSGRSWSSRLPCGHSPGVSRKSYPEPV